MFKVNMNRKLFILLLMSSVLYAGGGKNSKLAWDSSEEGEHFSRQRELQEKRDEKMAALEKANSSPAVCVTPITVALLALQIRTESKSSLSTPKSATADSSVFRPISEK